MRAVEPWMYKNDRITFICRILRFYPKPNSVLIWYVFPKTPLKYKHFNFTLSCILLLAWRYRCDHIAICHLLALFKFWILIISFEHMIYIFSSSCFVPEHLVWLIYSDSKPYLSLSLQLLLSLSLFLLI